MTDQFRLGIDPMPDWFVEARTANVVSTHNKDGRWRGGPDYALIRGTEDVTRKEFGEWITMDDIPQDTPLAPSAPPSTP